MRACVHSSVYQQICLCVFVLMRGRSTSEKKSISIFFDCTDHRGVAYKLIEK